MGMINIEVSGSFRNCGIKHFTARYGGHAQAVAEAIMYLSGDFLSDAIKLDHELHKDGEKPEIGFGERV